MTCLTCTAWVRAVVSAETRSSSIAWTPVSGQTFSLTEGTLCPCSIKWAFQYRVRGTYLNALLGHCPTRPFGPPEFPCHHLLRTKQGLRLDGHVSMAADRIILKKKEDQLLVALEFKKRLI